MHNKKLTNAARGENCTLQIVGVCNGNPETVVFCHFPDYDTHGMGIKSSDLSGGNGCSACHDVVDSRVINEHFLENAEFYMRRSQTRTMERLFERGILCLK